MLVAMVGYGNLVENGCEILVIYIWASVIVISNLKKCNHTPWRLASCFFILTGGSHSYDSYYIYMYIYIFICLCVWSNLFSWSTGDAVQQGIGYTDKP